jgi:hypothetical protein
VSPIARSDLSAFARLRAIGLSVLTCALLIGCVDGTGVQSARSASVLGGALQVGVPPGYCIDRAASREGRDSAVVIMGRCSDNVQAEPAVVTLAVGQPGTAGAMAAGGRALADFFTSRQGRATLARNGRADGVRVIEALSSGDAFLLHLTDVSAGDYWRAVLGVSGRLITVSVSGSPEQPLAPAAGRKVLDRTLTALRTANAG